MPFKKQAGVCIECGDDTTTEGSGSCDARFACGELCPDCMEDKRHDCDLYAEDLRRQRDEDNYDRWVDDQVEHALERWRGL